MFISILIFIFLKSIMIIKGNPCFLDIDLIILIRMITSRLFNLVPSLNHTLNYWFAVTSGANARRIANRQKPRPKLLTRQDKVLVYNPVQAIALMRLHTFTSFEQSVEVCIRLNVNPKNGEQIVRGTANLPAGLGKSTKTAVLCSDDEWQELQKLEVKVDFRIKQSQLKELEKGPIEFEKLFTTPSHIPKLKAYGRLLGPKGLMPNAKLGTLVPFQELPLALEQAKAGQVSFRVDIGRNIHAQIGKMSFTDEQLLRNWHAVMKSLVEKRPPTLKGKYFTEAYLRSTMGPGWQINLNDIDPRIEKSIWGILDTEEQKDKVTESV